MSTETTSETRTATRSKIYFLATSAVMTALLCVLAPLSIPIGPIPISLATFVIYLSVYILGWKLGTVSVAIYLLLGMVGLPVFSGYAGGLAKLVGPTGGYLIGYIPMAVTAGLIISATKNKFVHFAGLVAGTAVLYVFGTAWFCLLTKTAVPTALSLCVFPFIPGDIIKMIAALSIGMIVKPRLQKIMY